MIFSYDRLHLHAIEAANSVYSLFTHTNTYLRWRLNKKKLINILRTMTHIVRACVYGASRGHARKCYFSVCLNAQRSVFDNTDMYLYIHTLCVYMSF